MTVRCFRGLIEVVPMLVKIENGDYEEEVKKDVPVSGEAGFQLAKQILPRGKK